jgi:Zn-dependent protease with chaperone function
MQLLSSVGPEIIILFMSILMIALMIASLGLTIGTAIEIATKPFKNPKDKTLWLIIVLLLGFIGPVIYLFMRKDLLAKYAEEPFESLDINQPKKSAQPQPRASDEDYV